MIISTITPDYENRNAYKFLFLNMADDLAYNPEKNKCVEKNTGTN
jgi:hypothetical protein